MEKPSMSPQRERSFGMPVLTEDEDVEVQQPHIPPQGQQQQQQQQQQDDDADENNRASNNNSSKAKGNWHSRKISWGQDMILGQSPASSAEGNNVSTSATASESYKPQQEEIGGPDRHNSGGGSGSSSNSNKNYASSYSPAAMEATAAAAREQYTQQNFLSPDELQAEHIQSLFAGVSTYNSSTASRRNVSSLGNIDLDDVLKESPYETEAETYILRAIEDRERTSDGKTTDSNVLGDIPDDAISALSNRSSNDGDDGDDNSDVQHSGAHPSHASNSQRGGGGGGSGSHRHTTASRRTSVTAPAAAGGGVGGTSSNASPKPDGGRNHNYHRRNQTMEAQLFGLASAIDAMQTQNWDSSEQHWMGSSYPPAANVDASHRSSTEALQRNASMLYSRGTKSRTRLDSGFLSSGGGVTTAEDDSASSPTMSAGGTETNSRRRRSSVMLKGLSFRHKRAGSELSAGSSGRHSDANINDGIPEDSSHWKSLQLGDIEEGGDGMEDGNLRDSHLMNEQEDPNDGTQDPKLPSKRGKRDRKKNVERQLVRELHDFFAPQKTTIVLYFRVVFLYISLPLLGISAVMFYWGGNTPTGRLAYGGHPVNGTLWNMDGERVDPDQASTSWWLIYIIRLLVTFTLAKAAEKIFIDYLTIRTRGTIRLCGPWVTLLLLQSKGWPSTLFLWGIFNFCLLSGTSNFSEHWAYWQESIGLFNAENPGGQIIDSEWNHRLLAIAVAVGVLVAFKRLLLGLYLGKRTFNVYADQLARVMKNILMISEVAALAKDFEREMKIRANREGVSGNQYVAHLRAQRDKLFGIFDDMDDETCSKAGGTSTTADRSSNRAGVDYIVDTADRNPWSGSLSNTQQMRIVQLLGAWEEPVIAERKVEYISVSALLQFRRSMACLHTQFPFSGSFGLADTRENCIQSAQEVYRRLLLNEPDVTELNFETLALLGLQNDGTLNQAKLKEMIRLFRPNRDGSLSILEFVKSIDTVYKEIRMLRASVTNASKIDKSFETIFNFIFYAVVIVIILSQLGYSPMAMFLSISGVILAFAFMIGSASSKYFEGILFILVRRPYAIGDGIAVGNVESVGSFTGHPFWFVEDVTLFTTSVLYFYTGERATLSNGSLANSRIINVSRTPHAYMYILLKFPIDVSHEKLQIFHTAVEQFCRNRPREWQSFDSFRSTQVDAEKGFIEMMVVCTHRLSWVEWTTVHTSKADLINFCSELSKKLGIWYRAPPVPVDLTFKNTPDFSNMLPQQPEQQGTNMPSAPLSPKTQLQEPDLSGLQAMFPPRS